MAGDGVRRRANGAPSDASESRQTEEKVLKNRPKASALRQQKLPAWQPILTATTVIPTVFCVGILFIPIGVALYLASDGVIEHRLHYSQACPEGADVPCFLELTIDKDMQAPVYFYYYLSNYFQNHRRYVKSRNDQQYLGELTNVKDCEPFDKSNGLPIVPCGAIANSMFNDTFRLLTANGVEIPLTTKGVLWDVDEKRKFANPAGWKDGDGCTGEFKDFEDPPNWKNVRKPRRICEMPGGLQNVDFIVWMRTAALPNFRKLYRLLDAPVLAKGTYRVQIENNYPVHSFNGEKEFIVSTTSWAGGKNGFLGIAYLVVGSLCVLLGVIFIIIHYKFGHSVDELSNINRQ